MRAFSRLAFALGSCLAIAACSTGPGSNSFNSADGEQQGKSGAGGTAGNKSEGEGGSAGASEGEGGSAGSIDVTGGNGGGKECAASDYDAQRIPANMLIVVDRSGSMQDNGKWSGAINAISFAVDTSDDQLGMGILRFPEGKYNSFNDVTCMTQAMMGSPTPECKAIIADSGCQDINKTPNVPVGPLKDTRNQIKMFLNSTKPDGNTPTRWALRNAWEYMKGLKVNGDKFVLLLTDGEPTTTTDLFGTTMGVECGQLSDIANETWDASHAEEDPIRTFVIGAPGSESNLEILSGIAKNGGTGKPGCDVKLGNCHYQVGSLNFQDELKAVLTEIAGKVGSCVFAVPKDGGQEADPSAVNVYVSADGKDSVVYKDTSHQDGWDYTDGTNQFVELHGPQCDSIKQGLTSTVKISLGCTTIIKLSASIQAQVTGNPGVLVGDAKCLQNACAISMLMSRTTSISSARPRRP